MATLSVPVRNACAQLYEKIQNYLSKLEADGFLSETAQSIALMLTATIEGGIMLCLTKKTSEPLKMISHVLPQVLRSN